MIPSFLGRPGKITIGHTLPNSQLPTFTPQSCRGLQVPLVQAGAAPAATQYTTVNLDVAPVTPGYDIHYSQVASLFATAAAAQLFVADRVAVQAGCTRVDVADPGGGVDRYLDQSVVLPALPSTADVKQAIVEDENNVGASGQDEYYGRNYLFLMVDERQVTELDIFDRRLNDLLLTDVLPTLERLSQALQHAADPTAALVAVPTPVIVRSDLPPLPAALHTPVPETATASTAESQAAATPHPSTFVSGAPGHFSVGPGSLIVTLTDAQAGTQHYPNVRCVHTPYGVALESNLDLEIASDGTEGNLLPPTKTDNWAYIRVGDRAHPFLPGASVSDPAGNDALWVMAQGFMASAPGSNEGEGFGGDYSPSQVTIHRSADGKSGTWVTVDPNHFHSERITWRCS
jgi:hypothetical protein